MLVHVNKKSKKVVGGKNLPNSVPAVLMDNVSFHSEDSLLKWKYVYHTRIAPKRDLLKEALECSEIMELLEDAYVM